MPAESAVAVGLYVDGRSEAARRSVRALAELGPCADESLGDPIGSPRDRVADVGRGIEIESLLRLSFAFEGLRPARGLRCAQHASFRVAIADGRFGQVRPLGAAFERDANEKLHVTADELDS